MLERCPNCDYPVVQFSPNCTNHRASVDSIERSVTGKTGRHKNRPAPNRPTLNQLCAIVAELMQLTEAELILPKEGAQSRRSLARRLFMFVAFTKLSYKQKEIAAFLSFRYGVSTKVSAVRREIDTQPKVKMYYEQILERLDMSLAA